MPGMLHNVYVTFGIYAISINLWGKKLQNTVIQQSLNVYVCLYQIVFLKTVFLFLKTFWLLRFRILVAKWQNEMETPVSWIS